MIVRILALSALLACSLPSFAHDYQVGELLITAPWSRELPVELPGGSAYFTVENRGDQTDRLLAVSSPRAQHARLHAQAGTDGMMTMQEMTVIDIPAHSAVTFQPGATHVMLSGMEHPLKAGDHFPMTLQFEKAGTIEVVVNVAPAEAQASPHTAHVH